MKILGSIGRVRNGPPYFHAYILGCRRLGKKFRSLLSHHDFRAFFLTAYQGCFLIFVSVFRHSVSDPFPYLFFRPCLPLRTSFPRCPSSSRHEGAAASSVLSLRAFRNIPVRPTREFSHAGRGPAMAGMNG